MMVSLKDVMRFWQDIYFPQWWVFFTQLPIRQVSFTAVALLAVDPADIHQRPWSVARDDSFQLVL